MERLSRWSFGWGCLRDCQSQTESGGLAWSGSFIKAGVGSRICQNSRKFQLWHLSHSQCATLRHPPLTIIPTKWLLIMSHFRCNLILQNNLACICVNSVVPFAIQKTPHLLILPAASLLFARAVCGMGDLSVISQHKSLMSLRRQLPVASVIGPLNSSHVCLLLICFRRESETCHVMSMLQTKWFFRVRQRLKRMTSKGDACNCLIQLSHEWAFLAWMEIVEPPLLPE